MNNYVDVFSLFESDAARQIDTASGSVQLLDCMPRQVPAGRTADVAIVEAARTSTGGSLQLPHVDRALLRYLFRQRHTSPFEMVELKFMVSMPIFIARQWIRHRTASLNEYSARYAPMPDKFYMSKEVRTQGKMNRQGSEAEVEEVTRDWFLSACDDVFTHSRAVYEEAMRRGVSREQARVVMPVAAMTWFVWKVDLHNLLHFLTLRTDPHAQAEIRWMADAIASLVKVVAPESYSAWQDYTVNAVTLSAQEVALCRLAMACNNEPGWADRAAANDIIVTMSAGERSATFDKLVSLGILKVKPEIN